MAKDEKNNPNPGGRGQKRTQSDSPPQTRAKKPKCSCKKCSKNEMGGKTSKTGDSAGTKEEKKDDIKSKNPDSTANSKTSGTPVAPNSTVTPDQTSISTSIRMKGNVEFGYSKLEGFSRNGRMSYVLKAVDFYKIAMKKALNDTDRSKAAKNLAVSYDRLVQLEDREENKPKYYTSALQNYIDALQFGHLVQKENWNDEMFQKFSKLISELPSEKQATFIFGINDKIHYSSFYPLACEILLQFGEDTFSQALECFGKKKYKSGLPLLREIYRPIEEVKRYLGDRWNWMFESRSDEESRAKLLENDYHAFMDIGEALQSYSIGEDLLDAELNKTENNPHNALEILDFFQRSMILVKGKDAEIIAMALSKIGIIYHRLLNNTIRAKEAFKESINISSAMTENGNLYQNPWYVEMTKVMRQIQDDAQKKEDEKWERKHEVHLKKIKENGIYKKIWKCQYDSTKKMIEYFLKNFPPRHVQDLEKKKPTISDDDGMNKKKKALLVAISFYHPDKVMNAKDKDGNRIYNDEDVVIFEEVTKTLNSQYENAKGFSNPPPPRTDETEEETESKPDSPSHNDSDEEGGEEQTQEQEAEESSEEDQEEEEEDTELGEEEEESDDYFPDASEYDTSYDPPETEGYGDERDDSWSNYWNW